jgi:hypothetical protein
MKASEWLSGVPEKPGPDRDRVFMRAIYNGSVVVDWSSITFEHKDYKAELRVSSDALQIGEPGDSVRICVSAVLQQHIADWFDCILPTPKISDKIWQEAAVKLIPHPQTPDAQMGYTSRMAKHSKAIDNELSTKNYQKGDLISTVGKDWILVKKLLSKESLAANYGWHFAGSNFQGIKGEATVSIPGGRLIQGVGTAHNNLHEDYSQICRLIYRYCTVNGDKKDLADILSDPELAPLISHEGPLGFWRMPGVHKETKLPDYPEENIS